MSTQIGWKEWVRGKGGTAGGDERGRGERYKRESSKVRRVDDMSEYRERSKKERESIKHQKKHMDPYHSLFHQNDHPIHPKGSTYINRCNVRFAS